MRLLENWNSVRDLLVAVSPRLGEVHPARDYMNLDSYLNSR